MTTPVPPDLTQLQFAERVVTALLFGSIIGLERQWRQRMAGLRTNALVATGTALFVMVSCRPAKTSACSSPMRR